jgi:hypothetical protein
MNRPLFLVLIGGMLVGCGGEEAGPSQSEQVTMMIANLPDSANKPDRWESFFAAGAAPAVPDRPKYGSLMLHAMDAKLSGDEGTVKVLVEDINGAKVGDVEWTVVREGGTWKIKSAPLP